MDRPTTKYVSVLLDRPRRLRCDMLAQHVFRERFGLGIYTALKQIAESAGQEEAADFSEKFIVGAVWAMLHHEWQLSPDGQAPACGSLSFEQVATMIDLDNAIEVWGAVIQAATPKRLEGTNGQDPLTAPAISTPTSSGPLVESTSG